MQTIYPRGKATVTIPANESIAVYSQGSAVVSRQTGYTNQPTSVGVLGTVTNGQTVFGPYASGATIVIEAGAGQVQYAVGVNPTTGVVLQSKVQADPGVLNATGALTAAMMQAGLVTSTTAAAVVGTVPAGSVMDLAVDFAVNESFDWSAIATGANSFTVTAASGHTLVGSGVVATVTSGHFRTRKTAADTFITYRLS